MGAKGPMYLRYFSIPSSMGLRLARMLRCVMVTPFGSPVAPEVKRISAISSGAAGANDRRAASVAPEARRGSARPGSRDPMAISGRHRSAAPARSTIPAMRSTRLAEERKSTGTAITPSSRHPQSATTHSGRFSPQKRMRSPRAIPAARRRSAKAAARAPAASYVRRLADSRLRTEKLAAIAPPDFEERRERRRIADHLIDSSIQIRIPRGRRGISCESVPKQYSTKEEITIIMSTAVDSANLILKLYELRREETMRQARNFMFTFHPTSAQEYMAGDDGPEQRLYPDGDVVLGNGVLVRGERRHRRHHVRLTRTANTSSRSPRSNRFSRTCAAMMGAECVQESGAGLPRSAGRHREGAGNRRTDACVRGADGSRARRHKNKLLNLGKRRFELRGAAPQVDHGEQRREACQKSDGAPSPSMAGSISFPWARRIG